MPAKLCYLILFSPGIVLIIWTASLVIDGDLSDTCMGVFTGLLAAAAISAEGVRISLRRQPDRREDESNCR